MKLKIETIINKKKTIKIIICDEFIIYEGAKRIATSASIKTKILSDNGFEEFWGLYGKTGNKEKAKEMYFRALNFESKEYLLVRLTVYLNFLKVTSQFKLHASSWLNPQYKEYDNKNTSVNVKNKKRELNYNEQL